MAEQGTKFTKSEAIDRLEEWKRIHDNLEVKLESLSKLIGHRTDTSFSESPLGEAIWDMFSAYTEALRDVFGDTDDWIDWYWMENKWGQGCLTAKAKNMRRAKKIKTLGDLALLLGFE